MKARIIFEYKDEKIQEILKENDITTAAELKGWLKSRLQDSRSINVHGYYMNLDTFDTTIDVDYDLPKLKTKCTISDTQKLIDELRKEVKDLQKQNNELMDKIELLEDTPVECSTCCIHNWYDKAMAENKELKAKIDNLEEEKMRLKSTLESTRITNEWWSNKCDSLEKKIKELQDLKNTIKQRDLTIEDLEQMCKLNYAIGQKKAYIEVIDRLNDHYCISNPIYKDSSKKKYTRDEVNSTVNNVLIDYRIGLRTYFQSELDAIKW